MKVVCRRSLLASLWSSDSKLISCLSRPIVTGNSDHKRYFVRHFVEIMHEQDRIVPPIVAHRQHGWFSRRNHTEVAPADFRHFLAHADDALGPVQQGVRIAPLLRHVDMLKP